MAITNQLHSIIVSASTANFTAHTYTEVYAGVAATPIINGISISMAAGSSIKLTVQSITGGTTGVYLLGDNINTTYNDPILG